MNAYDIHIRKINRIQMSKCGIWPEAWPYLPAKKSVSVATVLMDAVRRQHSRSAKRDKRSRG